MFISVEQMRQLGQHLICTFSRPCSAPSQASALHLLKPCSAPSQPLLCTLSSLCSAPSQALLCTFSSPCSATSQAPALHLLSPCSAPYQASALHLLKPCSAPSQAPASACGSIITMDRGIFLLRPIFYRYVLVQYEVPATLRSHGTRQNYLYQLEGPWSEGADRSAAAQCTPSVLECTAAQNQPPLHQPEKSLSYYFRT